MRIVVTSVMVDDQDKALRFYTDVLGFVKKHSAYLPLSVLATTHRVGYLPGNGKTFVLALSNTPFFFTNVTISCMNTNPVLCEEV